MSEVKIATGVDRVWHWVHAVGIVLLALSGYHIHYPEQFAVFGTLEDAIAIHQFCGWLVIADFAVWLLYNLVTGRMRFYLPNREDLLRGSPASSTHCRSRATSRSCSSSCRPRSSRG